MSKHTQQGPWETTAAMLEELKRLRGVVIEMLSHLACGNTLQPGDVDIDMQKTDAVIAKATEDMRSSGFIRQ